MLTEKETLFIFFLFSESKTKDSIDFSHSLYKLKSTLCELGFIYLFFSGLMASFMPRQNGAEEWAPDLSIVSDTNTCSISVERRDAVTQNSAFDYINP